MTLRKLLPSLFLLLLTAPAVSQFVPQGSVWKYLDDGSNQGTAWQALGFNDSGWASGPAQLGYGDGDEATVVGYGPNANAKYPTTYFRHSFNVANPGSIAGMTLKVLRDDGAVVYLNGIEVARSNMPAGTINYLTWAASTVSGTAESTFYSFTVNPALLVAGTNDLAVEIHQRTGSSSDISFDLELAEVALPLIVPAGSVWKYLDDGSDQGTAWQALGFNDSGWASGPAQLGYGDGDENTVVGYGPNANAKYPTTFFRHSFNIANPGGITALTLKLLRDDGAVVYLNGTEVARSNMPAGTINYLTWAASTVFGAGETTFYLSAVNPALLVAGANDLAVEIHQRSGTSSDISFDLELTSEALPVLTRLPYLQNGTPNSVVVRWRTRDLTDSVVQWGSSPTSLVNTVSSPTLTDAHEIEITGLSPDTRYYYSVGDSSTTFAGGDLDHTFLTFPVAGTTKPTRIWVLGDSGTATASAAAVRDAYYNYTGTTNTDLWLMLGDNAYNVGSFSEYQTAVFDMYPDMLRKSTLYSTRGNHEDSASVYYGQFTFPTLGEAGGMPSGSEAYYSFDYANVHFVCLDSDTSSRLVGGPMLTWLASDLAATDKDWIIAFWHHPPYTKGSHDSDNVWDSAGRMFDMRQNALPILEDYGVDLVLSGHSHSYERSFLIDGHYGISSTFDPLTMLVDGGDGRETGTGVYAKTKAGHQGAVFTVAGSSGKIGGGLLNHPVMFTSLNQLGSVVIDVDGDRMDVSFLRSDGVVADWFTMTTREPGPQLAVQNLVAGQQATATVSFATPGNKVLLGWSIAGGGPISTIYGSVSLSPPINQVGPFTADPAGQVVIPVNLPAGTSNLPVWVQALELTGPGTGLLSNPLALIVQ